MKRYVDVFDYAGHICKAMKPGILLTTKAGDRCNTMTIGWGSIGVEWGKSIFIGFVRENRFTREMLRSNGEFTINIPYGEMDSKILSFCGTKSGRDVNKFEELHLTQVQPDVISVPGIREFPLTLECKVLYTQEQDLSRLPQPILDRYYPQNVSSDFHGSNRDYHVAFYAEIVASYIIE